MFKPTKIRPKATSCDPTALVCFPVFPQGRPQPPPSLTSTQMQKNTECFCDQWAVSKNTQITWIAWTCCVTCVCILSLQLCLSVTLFPCYVQNICYMATLLLVLSTTVLHDLNHWLNTHAIFKKRRAKYGLNCACFCVKTSVDAARGFQKLLKKMEI